MEIVHYSEKFKQGVFSFTDACFSELGKIFDPEGRHSSLNGLSPQERFFSEPEKIRRLSQFDADHSFMLETERRVSSDGVVSIDSKEYEVHYRYAKQRIRIRYSPDFSETYVVEPSGELTSIDMRPLNKKDNSLIKREKVRFLTVGEE
jgi:hypothetical protein